MLRPGCMWGLKMEEENTVPPTDGFSLAKVGEFVEGLYGVFGGIKISEAEADKFKYQAQVEALRSQLNEPQYDTQNIPEQVYSAGFNLPVNPYVLLGLGVLAAVIVARNL